MTGLAEALVKAQAEMPAVEPDAVNPHFRNRFVSLDHLIKKTRPVLNRHGLAVTQFPAADAEGRPVLRTILLHGPTGEQLSADAPLILGAKNDMQALGAAITYARRYAWAAALGITSEEDRDGSAGVDMSDPGIPFGDAVVPGKNAPPDKPKWVTEPQKRKLNVLIGELRDEGQYITTEQLWETLAARRGVEDVDAYVEKLAGRHEDGVLHWGPLRDSLNREEAGWLIDRLEAKKKQVADEEPAAAAPVRPQEPPQPPPDNKQKIDDRPITDAMQKALNALVGKLRDQGTIETRYVYGIVGALRGSEPDPLALEVGGVDTEGVLHWSPLRDTLNRTEGIALREHLVRISARADDARARAAFEASNDPG